MADFFGRDKYKLENLAEVGDLLNQSFKSREDVAKALQEIKNAGGGIDDVLQTSNLGQSINKFSNGSRYKSIDAAIIDLQKKISPIKEEIKTKEKEGKIEEGEIVKKSSDDNGKTRIEEKEEKKRKKEIEKKEAEEKKKTENTVEVEEQINQVSKKTADDLKGGEKLEKVIREDLEATIKGKTIKTDSEEVADLADKIANAMGREKDAEIMVEAKKIQISRKEYENQNIEKVRDYQKVNFEKDFVEETIKLNPNLNEDQISLIKKKADIIADVYFGNNGIEDQKNSALEFNQDSPRGARNTAWTDMQGITSLLKRSPKELEKIKGEYQDIKNRLGEINLPNIDKLKSFEGIMTSLQDPITNKLFGRAQKYVQLFDRIDTLTGGWLKRTTIEWGGKFATKIGNQAVSTFVQNSMSVLAEKGFEQGLSTILKGVFSGGVKATGTAAVKAGAGAAAKAGGKAVASFGVKLLAKLGIEAGVATVPVAGWVVALALVALDIVIGAIKIAKKIGDKIAEKLNLKLGIKDWLQDNLGKFAGGITNFFVKAAMVVVAIPTIIGGAAVASVATVLAPIAIIVAGVVFIFGGFQNNSLMVSLKPSTTQSGGGGSGDTNIPSIAPGDIVLPTITVGSISHQDLVNIATALKGKVYYTHCGYYSGIGVNPRWSKVPVSNPNYVCQYNLGLDCIGFVRWVYYQVTGGKFTGYISTIYSTAMSNSSKNPERYYFVDKSELRPGDMVMGNIVASEGRPGHIGLYLGKDDSGRYLFIHTNSTGTPVKICSDTYRYEGNSVCRWAFYIRPGKQLIDFTDD